MATEPSRSTGTLVKSLAAVAGALLAAALLWGMRSLVVPVVVGGLLAYICYPLVAGLERFRLTRGLAIGLLLLAFVSIGVFLVSRVRAGIPSEVGALELRVRALRNVNRRYKALMGLDSSWRAGNSIYRVAHDDLDPLVDRVNRLLALTPEEQATFLAAHPDRPDASADTDPLLGYHRENEETLRLRGRRPSSPEAVSLSGGGTRSPNEAAKRPLKALAGVLSTWVVAPAVFLFLLRDTGEIKRGFFRLVPNRLFEPALAVLADLDRALGGWLRGVFLECAFLGGAVAILLALLGVPPGWAILIGLVAGATNPVPYIGSAVALLGGLAFLLVADTVHPILPVGADGVAIWMIVGILLIEVVKNVVFEPLVLGEAVHVHPLVVLLGVLGGGLMFGLVGLVLALPAIAIFKTLVESASRQLKAYGLI